MPARFATKGSHEPATEPAAGAVDVGAVLWPTLVLAPARVVVVGTDVVVVGTNGGTVSGDEPPQPAMTTTNTISRLNLHANDPRRSTTDAC
jgi:hypothetical protein